MSLFTYSVNSIFEGEAADLLAVSRFLCDFVGHGGAAWVEPVFVSGGSVSLLIANVPGAAILAAELEFDVLIVRWCSGLPEAGAACVLPWATCEGPGWGLESVFDVYSSAGEMLAAGLPSVREAMALAVRLGSYVRHSASGWLVYTRSAWLNVGDGSACVYNAPVLRPSGVPGQAF